VKPEIINISLEFVADFCVLEKKNVLTRTLRKNVEFFNDTGDENSKPLTTKDTKVHEGNLEKD
jgi:hypothetical protein